MSEIAPIPEMPGAQEQIPEIENQDQYEACWRQIIELEAKASLPPRDSPEFDEAYVAFSGTPEGRLATALGAAMIEWEQRQGDNSAA